MASAAARRGSASSGAKKRGRALVEDVETSEPVPYPTTAAARKHFVNPRTKKPVTDFQFQVYDLCRQVPEGYVTTYKIMAEVLKSHPRAVGQALRVNPFAPLPIPCHRVLAADGFIGGYSGTWGEGPTVDRKRQRLQDEHLALDDRGYLRADLRVSRLYTF